MHYSAINTNAVSVLHAFGGQRFHFGNNSKIIRIPNATNPHYDALIASIEKPQGISFEQIKLVAIWWGNLLRAKSSRETRWNLQEVTLLGFPIEENMYAQLNESQIAEFECALINLMINQLRANFGKDLRLQINTEAKGIVFEALRFANISLNDYRLPLKTVMLIKAGNLFEETKISVVSNNGLEQLNLESLKRQLPRLPGEEHDYQHLAKKNIATEMFNQELLELYREINSIIKSSNIGFFPTQDNVLTTLARYVVTLYRASFHFATQTVIYMTSPEYLNSKGIGSSGTSDYSRYPNKYTIQTKVRGVANKRHEALEAKHEDKSYGNSYYRIRLS